MVILIHCEMDGDGHRSSKKSGFFRLFPRRTSPPSRRKISQRELLMPTERRPLRSVPFVGHNYRVEPEILVTEFVEKEAKLLGTVPDLDSDFDATDRSSLLKILDEQQAIGQLRCSFTSDSDIIISFSVHNIKLLRRDGEKLIQRIVTHKIAAVGYVRDDHHHLIFIKFASEVNPKMCNLAVLCCESKTTAEEVCSLAQQVFQLVYTDSAIDFLDKSIMFGAITPKNHSYSTDDSDKKDALTVVSEDNAPNQLQKSAESVSTTSFGAHSHTLPQRSGLEKRSASLLLTHRRSGSSGSSSNNVVNTANIPLTSPTNSVQRFPAQGELQTQDYLRVLKEQLTNIELMEFARLLNQFRTGGLMIQEFSDKLLQMYTEARKHLLLGMRHFIPDATDLSFFNNFLKENDVDEIPSGSSPSSWWAEPPSMAPPFTSEVENIRMSSSESERASTSVVSNDDSGEFKNPLGRFEKLRMQISNDSSGDADFEGSFTPVNGTPPKGSFSLVDSPFVEDLSVAELQVAPVAAVPPGFRDAPDEYDAEVTAKRLSSIKKSSLKSVKDDNAVLTMQSRDKQLSKSETISATEENIEDQRKTSEMSPKTSHLTVTDKEINLPSKPQKEHRKKKKHKKDITTAI